MKTVEIGGVGNVRKVLIGGENPLVIQTMWKERLSLDSRQEETETLKRIENLSDLGCGLLRFACPDIESAETLGKLASLASMPVSADIHFDYKIAMRCMDFPIAKIRINPGNIGNKDKVSQVLQKAKDKSVPIRIGVNLGSLPADLRNSVNEGKITNAEALVQAAVNELEIFSLYSFDNVLVSMKASGIEDTIKSNILFASKYPDTPLHIGVTEAGPLIAGVVRSSIALYSLLCLKIGNTIRVSLSDTMEKEIIAAREIILAVNDYHLAHNAMQKDCTQKNQALSFNGGVRIVSCPRCGRCSFDTHKFTEKYQNYLYGLKKNITVAIMGCPVNGPGEAREADIGITGAGGKVLIFKHGEIIKRANPQDAETAFKEVIESL
ncbi:MAG: (E)-4-hydroxy-3-methylbut-2-enyl-diphosphate synthase [Spirochaetaceae bacterium]|jgi:(E)-4-hydroxy-3-methylbut-2-enyl-diphosphate synthase|nr:(E)-4-hydroxy-3-methylbut-2-enyl-diphosphate synthase [Spirochaetaceae bacterium]